VINSSNNNSLAIRFYLQLSLSDKKPLLTSFRIKFCGDLASLEVPRRVSVLPSSEGEELAERFPMQALRRRSMGEEEDAMADGGGDAI